MKTFMICLVILSSFSLQIQAEQPSDRVKALGLARLEGRVPVHHSEGYAERAAYLQGLAEDASIFFQKPGILGVKMDLQLAVLGAEDWAKFTKLPYGIAHVLDEPPTAILAASADNVIVRGLLAKKDRMTEATLTRLKKLDMPLDEAAGNFVDLIAFHEMGHIYAHHHGSDAWPAQKWLSEFVATYIAYAYMRENQPKLATLWDIMCDQMALSSESKHTTLADFEKLYLGVGNDNYGWYQARFGQKVKEIYATLGITFLPALKKSLAENPTASADDPFRLKELTAIDKRFENWAKGSKGDLK